MVATRKRFKTTPKASRNAATAATSTTHKRKSKQKLNSELLSLLFTATSAAHSFPLPQPHSPPSLPNPQPRIASLFCLVTLPFTNSFLSLILLLPFSLPFLPRQTPSGFAVSACRGKPLIFSCLLSPQFYPLHALHVLPLPPSLRSYKSLSRRFGFPSAADAYHVFYTVCKAINAKLGKGSLGTIREEFWWVLGGFCCLIVVEYWFGKFDVDTERLGRNGSLLVQALVDSEGRFLHISAGWPCSILHQTKFFSGVEESRQLLNGPIYDLSDGNLVPQYILRDVCFPLLPWLITPYARNNEEDSFGSAENDFNAVHSRTMGLVHTAFGRVKARWQLLARRWKEECLQFFLFVIVTGCLPHNC